jgi:hypothetical protein
VARILIVGAPTQLGEELQARGHAVRSLAEPDTLAGILPQLQGVSALAWLGRTELLESLAAKLVDTHVRGFACGPDGEAVAERFARTYGMPTAIVRGDPGADADAVESLLSAWPTPRTS